MVSNMVKISCTQMKIYRFSANLKSTVEKDKLRKATGFISAMSVVDATHKLTSYFSGGAGSNVHFIDKPYEIYDLKLEENQIEDTDMVLTSFEKI